MDRRRLAILSTHALLRLSNNNKFIHLEIVEHLRISIRLVPNQSKPEDFDLSTLTLQLARLRLQIC